MRALRVRWWVRLVLAVVIATAGLTVLVWAWSLHSSPECPPAPSDCILGSGSAVPMAVVGILLELTAAGMLATSWIRRSDRS
ncbi:MAG TPA: hypothetical protein VF112_03115 [Candidatus Dormibacteraeota bacterium]